MSNRRILYSLRCHSPNGGCIKVRDYYNHATFSSLYRPSVYLPADNQWGQENPWLDLREQAESKLCVDKFDALFISGLGWDRFIPESFKPIPEIPIIYLVQSLFKLKPEMPHYKHFSNRAIRICVSNAIADELTGLKIANGPVFCIPNCIDHARIPISKVEEEKKEIECLLVGIKNHKLAGLVSDALSRRGIVTSVVTERIPQQEFLGLMQKATTTIYLPQREEGFYLPALEGMGVGTTVVCPNVLGNGDFCIHGFNCFVPSYEVSSIVDNALRAISLENNSRKQIIVNASITYEKHNIKNERKSFLEILDNIDQIW